MSEIKYVICIDNSEYPASLEKRKLYEAVPDTDAEELDQIRIIDESGEDYLYPSQLFVDANLSKEVQKAVEKAA